MAIQCPANRRKAMRGFRSSAIARDVFKEKEMGEENLYFRKEDQARIAKLLEKMKAKEEGELVNLKELIAPHELPLDVLKKIVDWKHHD
eukprot:CAMPEP_0197296498 /NCGR_PEP_ID=MMETSP0890-20130614/38493_1 /TAXON_ID=44058 ORGANISM="Aureoumbra lagunensis, Strain CCMP1510" /NCGR_SAMPLE_ID=MMETSP0890 /ASSEMBLY_ACC=CAM_ASM_000533 /LENGTH=88 /DNA_ID=CAMNT_0042773067 /DNA_START=82 /DNA_END=348 /DNA_ORIENTATION=-